MTDRAALREIRHRLGHNDAAIDEQFRREDAAVEDKALRQMIRSAVREEVSGWVVKLVIAGALLLVVLRALK